MRRGLKRFWAANMWVARAIGSILARILLTVIYAVLVLPFGLISRLFSDPLRTKTRPGAWLDYPPVSNEMDQARHQG
jgi:hypothetical protein